ncbi:uncharacterized protein LOC131180138 [Hevea brasiliensis]|uniref:uncharacterized protein LOC131180138 n=1 Tax=Hevea brasiliensis TaxID=3981 RepID=UPI0025CF6989|nr:uncharacterized protein LOC131180138 [Hevea brasiliensis]
MLENQIAQQASPSSKKIRKLPSQPEMNPKEHCKTITLRSERTLQEQKPKQKQKQKEETSKNSETQEDEEEKQAKEVKEKEKRKKKKLPKPYQSLYLFLKDSRKPNWTSKALSQMSSYIKFLKEIFSKKSRLEDYETVVLTEESSAILQNKLPPKLKDLGSFSIPCLIRNMNIDKALCDLRASVSLMPLSICQKLNVGELRPTTISLQLANKSVKYPVGILESIPIKVDNFFIPADFVVLEIVEDVQIPMILGMSKSPKSEMKK